MIFDKQQTRFRRVKLPFLAYISGASSFLPVVAALYRNRSVTAEVKPLLILFSIGAFNTTLEFILAFMGVHNLFLAHFYLALEFLFLIWVFSRWSNPDSILVLRGIMIVFVLFWIVVHLTIEQFTASAYYTSLATKILLFGIAVVSLHRIAGDGDQSILQDARFWILAGVLIYSSGGILFAALRPLIDRLPLEGLVVAYSVHWVIDSLTNIVYAIGFLCKPRNSGGQLELAQ